VDRFTDAPRTAVALLMASDVWATADIVRSFGARVYDARGARGAQIRHRGSHFREGVAAGRDSSRTYDT